MELADAVAAFTEAAIVSLDGSGYGAGDVARAQAVLAAHPAVAQADVFTAAILGNEDAVRRFVEADALAATRTGGRYGWDPLTYLCFSRFLREDAARPGGFVGAARVLLAHGASAKTGFHEEGHQPSPCFESALYGAAAIAKHLELTRLLLEHGADPNDEETPYHVPEGYENDVMKLLVTSGRVGKKALTTMLARKHDWHDYDGVAWLLAHGADPNEVSAWGRRALHQALERDNAMRFVDLLLDHGADPTLAKADGTSAVALAARSGRADALDLFARRGFAVTLEGVDALLAACARAGEAAARALLAKEPALVGALATTAPSALADFASAGNTAGVALLLDLGVDPAGRASRPGMHDDTALHAALWRARHDTAKLLIARGAPLEATNARGQTPLAYAVRACFDSEWSRARSTETIEALLAAGADVRAVAGALPTGWAPLDALLSDPRWRRSEV